MVLRSPNRFPVLQREREPVSPLSSDVISLPPDLMWMRKLALNMFRKRKALVAVVVVLCFLGGGYIYFRHFRYNMHAPCANCRRFLLGVVEVYAREHDGWYPRGEKTPYESLSLAIKDENDVGLFASHAMRDKLVDSWRKNKRLAAELCCYGYVEGLKVNAPSNLLLFYTKEPSYWECYMHKKKVLGRAVGTNSGGHWDFCPEEEFQRFLQRTQEYLRAKGRLGRCDPALSPR